MPDQQTPLRIGILLPHRLRRDLFDPAVQDLRIERLTQRRAWPRLRFAVAVTAADPATWGGSWRRVRAVRPDVAGQYVISGLPAGTYLLAALTDVDTDEWKDAAFLAPLVPASIKLAPAEGETKTQNLRLGK